MIRKAATAAAAIGTLILGTAPTATALQDGSAYDFTLTAIDGTPLPLDRFRGKVLLIVNTASLCGFTRQYEGLQAIWESYRATVVSWSSAYRPTISADRSQRARPRSRTSAAAPSA
jgi:hypothetical protein